MTPRRPLPGSAAHPRVAVVGGGIAGLTFALAAHRAGLEVDVYEKSRQPRESEAGLQLSPNAVRSLYRLGAGPGLRSVSSLPHELHFRHWREGTSLLRVPIRPAYARRFGAEHHVLLRADLRETLLRLLPEGTVHYGERGVGLREDARGVRLDFADGTFADADIAVGADGTHSSVRGHADDPTRSHAHGKAVHSGMDAYRAVGPAGSGGSPSAPAVRVWLGSDRHFLCYPVDGGRRVNLVLVAPSDPGSDPDVPWSEPADSEHVAGTLADWDPAVPTMIRDCSVMHRKPLFDRDPLPTWSTPRTTLIGDAAHPMLPHQAQGACQAIEDAVALATLLAHTGRLGIPEALNRYEALRAPRTARVQQASREYGELMHSPRGAELLAELEPPHLMDLMAPTYAYDIEEQARAAALA